VAQVAENLGNIALPAAAKRSELMPTVVKRDPSPRTSDSAYVPTASTVSVADLAVQVAKDLEKIALPAVAKRDEVSQKPPSAVQPASNLGSSTPSVADLVVEVAQNLAKVALPAIAKRDEVSQKPPSAVQPASNLGGGSSTPSVADLVVEVAQNLAKVALPAIAKRDEVSAKPPSAVQPASNLGSGSSTTNVVLEIAQELGNIVAKRAMELEGLE
jgi:hypothetical protein